MTPVVYLMIWTYATLLLGWWVGRHWDCATACSRWCVSDARVDRALGRDGTCVAAGREALRLADDVDRETTP